MRPTAICCGSTSADTSARDRAVEPMRSIAIYGDKIFVNTADAHIVALNVKTGAVAWDHQVADNALGYEYTSGPIIAKGKVVAGMTGCTRYKEDVCFISAHDPETGRELWRTATVAQARRAGRRQLGRPAPYASAPAAMRGFREATTPRTNLIYWSTAQAKPWARAVRGTDGDALYTNSTLALDPDTGKMSWYYQYLPGETHDMDEVFESILIDQRRQIFALQDGQARHPVGARPQDRQIHQRARHRLSDAARCRSADRQGDISARQDSARSASK